MKGIIHCHSEESRYDSTMKVKELCERAKECGYEAVTLTDHGVLTGIDEFVKVAKELGLKPIPGVEAYMQEEESEYKRFHLILLAVDDFGYQGISKAVTDSNKRVDSRGFARMNKEILERYFSKGKPYHGHVIATSACVGGVLAGLALSPLEFDKAIRKLRKRQETYESPTATAYIRNKECLELALNQLEELTIERGRLTQLSKKPFKKKEKMVEKQKGTETYEAALRELNLEKEETEQAQKDLETIRVEIALKKRDASSINAEIKKQMEQHEKYNLIEHEIKTIELKKIKGEDLFRVVSDEAIYYESLFGKGNFFIEIQYHGYTDDAGVEIEKMAFQSMVKVAEHTGIPLVAANDAHMTDGSKESIRARQLIRSLRTAKNRMVCNVTAGDYELYVKSEEELKASICKIIKKEIVEEAIQNTYKVCERCNCNFDHGSHYPKFIGMREGETADEALRRVASDGIKKRFPDPSLWTEEYEKRFEYELSIISKMGFSDYFLIIQDTLGFARKLGNLSNESLEYLYNNVKDLTYEAYIDFVETNQTEIGFTVGAGRGSAVGSLIAYLVEITNIIDPIKYDLLFERFLNEDRVSMPDVDSDFSPDIRDLTTEYCRKKYGNETVAKIVTKGYVAPRSAIRNVARILGIEKDRKDYYLFLADKIAKLIPNKPGMNFSLCEKELRNKFEISAGDDRESKQMKQEANEIIDQAKMIENVFVIYGMHPAGVIIADGHAVSDYVPLMLDDKSGDMKVQCDMTQAEETHGLLKLDFLVLRNLKIVTQTIRSIKKRTGKIIDVEHLPMDAKVFKYIFAAAKTGSVFQFESPGMKSMLNEANPENLEDLIALVSLYRPGPMDFIPKYIEQKAHPERIKYLCPQLKPILSNTYGVIVYQEQVMQIVRELAGFSLPQADNVRRYMSKKKVEKLEHERESFIRGDLERGISGCLSLGITEDTANEIFDQMVDFAKYAFNKSHAAAYAVLSYITGYLKYYYPADYMVSVLNCSSIKKIPAALNDCHEMGIEVMPPEVNKSQIGFTIYGDRILFGLDSIKGTKIASVLKIMEDRATNGTYSSFKEFLRRDVADKSTVENMIKAGSFDEFNSNRYALQNNYSASTAIVAKLTSKEVELETIKTQLQEDPTKESLVKKQTALEETIDLLAKQFEVIRIVDSPENLKEKLKAEKEVLGFFVSAHPMDEYRSAEELGCTSIVNLADTGQKVSIIGLVEGLKITARKSDNKAMALFNLEDKTDTVEVCCFTKAYENYGELLEEDAVVKLTGYVNEKEIEMRSDDEEEEGTKEIYLSFYVDSIKLVHPDLNDIRIAIRDISEWNVVLSSLKNEGYLCESGHPLTIYDCLNGEFRSTKFYIKDSVLIDERYHTPQSF